MFATSRVSLLSKEFKATEAKLIRVEIHRARSKLHVNWLCMTSHQVTNTFLSPILLVSVGENVTFDQSVNGVPISISKDIKYLSCTPLTYEIFWMFFTFNYNWLHLIVSESGWLKLSCLTMYQALLTVFKKKNLT